MVDHVKRYTTFLIDLDGVIWRGEKLLAGAANFVALLESRGDTYRFLSNNSMISPADVAQKMRRLGIPVADTQVMTASLAAVRLLAHRFPHRRAWVTGLASLRQMVADVGLQVINLQQGDESDDPQVPAESADVVLVGLDRTLTYRGLQQATRALLHGAAFIAVNRDPQLPVEESFDPGCGAILAALETASKRTGEIVGKPSPNLLLETLDALHADFATAVMIGDAIEMDIMAGQAAGIDTILVLSGITSREMAQRADPQPTLIIQDLAELLRILER